LQLKQLLELDITEEIELVMPELTEKDILTPLPSKQTLVETIPDLATESVIRSGKMAGTQPGVHGERRKESTFRLFLLHNRRDRIGDAGAYGERYLNPASEQANDLQYLSGCDAANKEQ